MSAREELIAKYATDLKDKCGVNPNMDLLTKVTIGCGPSIYNADSATVAGSQQSELDTVKNNFLIKKLGLTDGSELDKGIQSSSVLSTCSTLQKRECVQLILYLKTLYCPIKKAIHYGFFFYRTVPFKSI